jgi:hypothetical protein
VDEIKVNKMAAYMAMSEGQMMDLGLIPDTRPPAPRPSCRRRARWKVAELVRPVRLRLAARLGGVSREGLEEVTWL